MVTHEVVGRRIKEAREALGLSQAALGRLLMPPRTHAAVSDIERGKTRLDVEDLAQLAAILNRDLSYFYGEPPAPGIVYRRGDRGLTPQAQRQDDAMLEAFKQFAREHARSKQEQKEE
jgi:transcriptional regulator with XRE-family HTH domain